MIVRAAPALAPAEAARRVAAAGADPIWLSSPELMAGGKRHERAAGSSLAPAQGGDDTVAIRSDVVAADPWRVVRGRSLEDVEHAWAEARERWRAASGLTGASGAWAPENLPIGVGWFSYDLARQWRPESSDPRPPSAWPDLELRFFDALWIRDARTGEAHVVARDHAAAAHLLDRLERAPAGRSVTDEPTAPELGELVGDRSRAFHEAAVERIRDYLRAGDAYQVNLARRLSASIGPGDPVWIAARLREHAPAPYAIWMGARGAAPRLAGASPSNADDAASSGRREDAPLDTYLVGNSPERFLRLRPDGVLETRPIKGTRPRGGDPATDAAFRAELAGSAKDRAEHVMIVDLERNDLGRICEIGSVCIEDLMCVVELPTVFHLVSTVRGRLRPGLDLAELLRATFPGGSITGAPKRRAMEIIDELEPVRRGIYTGATGWLGAAGDLDLAVAIRTATVADGRLSLFVGGGIVVDSDPAAEFAETEVKARAFQQLRDPGEDGAPANEIPERPPA